MMWDILLLDILGDNEDIENKFKVGDFVNVINVKDIPQDQIFIIWKVPKRHDPKVYYENKYYLSTIDKNNKFYYAYEFYESQLKKYEGEVLEDSPLNLLRNIYTDKIKVSDEIIKRIENNEIILNLKPTYKDIEELNKGQ